MLVLALDTTTRPGSAAIARDGRLIAEFAGDPEKPHGQRLPGDLIELLDRAGLGIADVDVYGVVAGPGSFTGLRVGIATIQGLALVQARPVVPLSGLEILARLGVSAGGACQGGELVGVWIDARRHEIFSGLYRFLGEDVSSRHAGIPSLDVVENAAVGTPAETIARWTALGDASLRVIGDGALAYERQLREAGIDSIVSPVPPLAPMAAAVATWKAERGETVSPHGIQPVYVRRPDAELARDRRAASGLVSGGTRGD